MNIFNANLEVTKATVQGGEIKELEINRQNVPLASSVKGANMLYAWQTTQEIIYSPYSVPPADLTEFNSLPIMASEQTLDVYGITKYGTQSAHSYSKVSDTEFSVVWTEGTEAATYTRNATKDIEVW